MADLTVVGIPVYFGGMGIEHAALRRRAQRNGGPAPTDYEWHDTVASLSMGVLSLVAPMVVPKVVGPLTPGKGRYGKALLAVAGGAAIATTLADVLRQRDAAGQLPEAGRLPTAPDSGPAVPEGATPGPADAGNRSWRRKATRLAQRISASGGVTAVAAGGTAMATTWAARTTGRKLFEKRLTRDLGSGALAVGAAIVAWDLIYYWNHRLMHESRFLWAIHVVHHSSERYNLSTALRQPVADSFGVFVPMGLLSLFGIRPELIETARGVNLLYQFWVHTDAVGKLGPVEEVLSTPSHHRVHHGSNQQYLDRNHGGILILWDRLFGTFEREDEPVVYGLTKNIHTFNPARIATNEHAEMLRDVARSNDWNERLSFVLRGPGWAYRRHAELTGDPPPTVEAATVG